MNLICQKCYKTKSILEALGKLQTIDGYLQCKDCNSDLEYESVVVRQIHFNNQRHHGIKLPKWLNDDLEKKGLLKQIKITPLSDKIKEKLNLITI